MSKLVKENVNENSHWDWSGKEAIQDAVLKLEIVVERRLGTKRALESLSHEEADVLYKAWMILKKMEKSI